MILGKYAQDRSPRTNSGNQPILAPSSNSDPLINEPVLNHFYSKVFKASKTIDLENFPQNTVTVSGLLSPSGTIQSILL